MGNRSYLLNKILFSSQSSTLIQEKESELIKTKESFITLSEKYGKLEKKLKETKIFLRWFRHSKTIQWKYWNKFYPSASFMEHSETWMIEDTMSENMNMSSIEIAITQTLIREDESSKKPFTIYVIEIILEGENWSVQRKYKEFCQLHDNLTNYYPHVKFPSASSQFNNKSLWDIVK